MNLRKIASIAIVAIAIALSVPSVSAQSAFKFKPVARTGDIAPVPPQLSSVLEFTFSDQGQVALIGDGGLILKSGSQITPIAAIGDQAPGGGFFFSLDVPSIGPQGQVIFRGNAAFPSTSGLDVFANGTITQLIPDGTLSTSGESVTPGAGRFIASGELLVADAFSGALFLFANGTLTHLVGPGDPAPGGGTFTLLLGAAINNSKQIAFQAFTSTGANGIFLFSGGITTKIIASGDVMPDGVPFGFPDAPTINDSGQVVFGGISNSLADSGIFSFSNGQRTVVIPRLAALPGGTALNVPLTTSLNNAGQIAFSALTISATNDTGVFLFSGGQISTVELAGQPAPDGGTFQSGVEVGAAINASGQVLFIGSRAQHGVALYLSSGNQLSRVIGQGDTIPRQPTFVFPAATGIGANDLVLIADSTFPGGNGAFTATPGHGTMPAKTSLVVHIGESTGIDGVVDFLFGFTMNHAGQVAASIGSSDALGTILLSQQGSFSVVADSAPGSLLDPNGGVPAINDLGEIAFTAFQPATQTSGVFLNSNGANQLLLNAATTLPGGGNLTNILNLVVNNSDQLAFMAQPFPGPTGIFIASNGTVTSLATDGAPAPGGGTFLLFFGNPRSGPVIDNRGDVAFASFLSGTPGGFFGSGGIFIYKDGVVSRIVGPNDQSPDGGVFLFADSPTINSSGDVAFFAETSAFGFGAFVYSKGQITQVAIAGDFVNNDGLGFVDQPVINENGHVAFTASLFDGSNAIFVAAPTGDTNPALKDWVDSTPGFPPVPERMKALRDKNIATQSLRPHNHPGQNVRIIDEASH